MSSIVSFNQTWRALSGTGSRLIKTVIAILLVFITILSSSKMLSQATSATLNGAITDASGASVPSASVKVTNVGTNLTRQVVSDSQGLYSVPQLPPGTYTVEVTSKGFRKYLQTGGSC